MSKPKLTYFDAPVSRGEECRLTLHCAGVDFEDNRIPQPAWAALKPTTPYGSMPILDLPGRPPLAQCNAILVYLGREHGLHPMDGFEAARHEGMMAHVEDLRAQVSPTLRMQDPEKKKAREALATGYIPAWAGYAEKQLGDGPYFAGTKLNVVDIKLFVAVRWFAGGAVDYVPATIFSAYPKLSRVHDAVQNDARIKAWYAKR
jgi:glutathione S-transferase